MPECDIKEETITFTVFPQKIKGTITLTLKEPLNIDDDDLKEYWTTLFQQKLKKEKIHINSQQVPLHLIEVKLASPTGQQAPSIQVLVESKQEQYKLFENKDLDLIFFSKLEDSITQLNELILDRPESLKNHPIFEYWTIKNGIIWHVQRDNSLRPHNFTRGGYGFKQCSMLNLEHIERSRDGRRYVPYGGRDTIFFMYRPNDKTDVPQQRLRRVKISHLLKAFRRKQN